MPFDISESLIRENTSPESFRRGEDYYSDGAVASLTRRGALLQAKVQGSQYEPYRVQVFLDEDSVVDADCDCPYDWGGWCKHIVATLLALRDRPDTVEERQPIEPLLADLDREQLRTLLLSLLERDAFLADIVEAQIALLQPTGPTTPQPPVGEPELPTAHRPLPTPPPVDAAAVRRRVHTILHSLDRLRSSEAYWQIGGLVNDVGRVVEEARAFTRAGEGRSALTILEAVTGEYVEGWTELDDSDGELGDFFDELGAAWTEAILTADLTPDERESWAEKLAGWADEADQYGIEDAFYAAEAAAVQGWDDPALQQALRGEIADPEAWAEQTRDWPEGLVAARLDVLDRLGRHQEYLHLAVATGQTRLYVTMLARLGRVAEAVEHGRRDLASTTDALAVAKALHEQGELEQALGLAEHGLTLEGSKAELATWLRDQAAAAGQTERALAAATTAFQADPNLAAYLRVQELAGERWPEPRERLLAYLRQTRAFYPKGPIDVFLHESLIDDAIAAVEGSMSYDLIAQVADAAVASHPDWVIQASRRQAESIMDGGKAQHYHHAVRWLAKTRLAYHAAGRHAEWQAYLASLLDLHSRKYKLVPMLEALERD